MKIRPLLRILHSKIFHGSYICRFLLLAPATLTVFEMWKWSWKLVFLWPYTHSYLCPGTHSCLCTCACTFINWAAETTYTCAYLSWCRFESSHPLAPSSFHPFHPLMLMPGLWSRLLNHQSLGWNFHNLIFSLKLGIILANAHFLCFCLLSGSVKTSFLIFCCNLLLNCTISFIILLILEAMFTELE